MQFKQVLLLLALSVLSFAVEVQANELYLNDVLKETFANHPDLKVSQLNIQKKESEGLRIEAALDTRYGGGIGASDEISPVTSPFSAGQTKVAFFSGQVTQPFADGSTLTGMLNYNRVELVYPSSVPANFQSNPNPIYKHQIDLVYRYPLANGSGNPSYRFQKEANTHELKAAELSVLMLREQLANQAIALYFQLVFSDLSLKLADDAVVRAEQLLSYQKKREQFGLIEKAERLQAEALLAMREMQQVQANSARNKSQTSLNRFMFHDGNSVIKPIVNTVNGISGSVADLLQKAKANRPVFEVLDAQYEAAKKRFAMAQANDGYQLDLVGQLGSRALDADSATALSQGLTLNDRYIGLSIEFSDVWNRSAERAAVQQSALAIETIKLERVKVVENLETELANIHALIHDSKIIFQASKKQVSAEKKKYRAEMARYREGRSTTAVVTQFEGDLRASELRLLIQQVSLDQADYQLALALGELPLVLGVNQ